MKSFGFLILIALIAFVLSINNCIDRADGKLLCCWWNRDSCCDKEKPRGNCKKEVTRCCKVHEFPKPVFGPYVHK